MEPLLNSIRTVLEASITPLWNLPSWQVLLLTSLSPLVSGILEKDLPEHILMALSKTVAVAIRDRFRWHAFFSGWCLQGQVNAQAAADNAFLALHHFVHSWKRSVGRRVSTCSSTHRNLNLHLDHRLAF
jgi:hypothetical protein